MDPTGQFGVSVGWLWRSAFELLAADGTIILLDPFLTGNPHCPETHQAPDNVKVDIIGVTHEHSDHVGDTVALAKRTECPIVCPVDLRPVFEEQGLPRSQIMHISFGGSITMRGIRFSLVPALHAGTYQAGGLVVSFPSGLNIYHAGDTGLFGDMALIRMLHKPQLALLPIGDRFTMDPYQASLACRLFLQPEWTIPHHYPGDYREPTDRDFVGEYRALLADTPTTVIAPEPGQRIVF